MVLTTKEPVEMQVKLVGMPTMTYSGITESSSTTSFLKKSNTQKMTITMMYFIHKKN